MRRMAAAAALLAGGGAYGRAGGGGHGGSSGHSSSGGHSSGHFGSGGGLVGFLVLALVVYFFIRRSSRGTQMGSMASREPMQSASVPAALAALGTVLDGAAARRAGGTAALYGAAAQNVSAAAAQIRARDPGFELEMFLQRAEMIFFLVKRGIQQNDAAAIRPYLDDRIFAAVSNGIAQAMSHHQHALLESLNVRAVHVESAACDESFQRIDIHFDLVYRAVSVSTISNQVISDEGSDQRHGERWTFSRSATARTPENGGAVASRCPACGAELRLNLDGTCTHCRAGVANGTVDWVVTDVQGAPFIGYGPGSSLAAAAPSIEEGVASLHTTDPGFSIDAFQARARTAFLALQDAWCRQNLDGGRGFLSPGAYFTWRAQVETMAAEGRRNVMENVSVQRIDPVQIVHGRVFDDLTVRVSASAADFEVDRDNRIVFGDRTVRGFTEDWTFQRSVGVATTQKAGTLENTCPSCGAPIALNQIGECRYCRAAVTSGKFDWVVSRIEQEADGPGQGADPGATGRDLALQVGGAVVGGLLASLLSERGSNSSRDWN